jgi:hypothetical protein
MLWQKKERRNHDQDHDNDDTVVGAESIPTVLDASASHGKNLESNVYSTSDIMMMTMTTQQHYNNANALVLRYDEATKRTRMTTVSPMEQRHHIVLYTTVHHDVSYSLLSLNTACLISSCQWWWWWWRWSNTALQCHNTMNGNNLHYSTSVAVCQTCTTYITYWYHHARALRYTRHNNRIYCTVLYCTVLYCTVLYCTVLYCTVLYCTVLYC